MNMMQAMGVGAATKMYGRDCTGAVGDTCSKQMSDISGASAGDLCGVWNATSKTYAFYEYVASGITEDYPDEVDDDNEGVTAGWRIFKGQTAGKIAFGYADPENLPTDSERSQQVAPFWCNWTGRTMNIQEIYAWADEDEYNFKLYITSTSTNWSAASDSEVDTTNFTVDGNGTDVFYGVNPWDSGFEDTTVTSGQCLLFRHISGTAGYVYGYIKGYLN